jgi:hypothetical protein
MKQSHLKSSSNNDIAEVVDADVEGATANEEIKWSLVRPESSGRKVFSKVWSHFKVFNYVIHPDKKGCVVCILCFEAKNYDCGTICAKGGNTSGLMLHMKIHHAKQYNDATKGSLEGNTNGCQDITSIFQPQEKQRYLGIGDCKGLFKTLVHHG